MLIQNPNEIVDVTDWVTDEQLNPYPEGARSKKAIECPDPEPYEFLLPGHRYLFKHSNEKYPAQFWAEIIAYRVGCLVGVEVPPAFVAIDNEGDGHVATLIEWFYGSGVLSVRYVSGGDYIERLIPGFDRKKGTGHNFETIMKFSRAFQNSGLLMEAVNHWAKVLTFDAIIGNTDRHQDNWGVVYETNLGESQGARFSPAFDNGTALGHEIVARKLQGFLEPARISTYIEKGKHHLGWSINEPGRLGHVELLTKLVTKYPEAKGAVQDCLTVDWGAIQEAVFDLCDFRVQEPLTTERAEFVVTLLHARLERLKREFRPNI